jgi:hypothetical protein
LIAPGPVLAEVRLNTRDLLDLKGTPLPQDAALDELRLKDVPQGAELKPGQRLDPLIHYAGQVAVSFVSDAASTKAKALAPFIDHASQTVTSATRELRLDYGKGILRVDAPRAQGVSGALKQAGPTELQDIRVSSNLDLGHIIAVSLDDEPLAKSSRILLQVMSEEREMGRRTEAVTPTVKRIVNLGSDPWQVKEFEGIVSFKRADAAQLTVKALDFNGYPVGTAGSATEIQLQPSTMYYLISR